VKIFLLQSAVTVLSC